METHTVNNVKVGPYTVDLFVTEDGKLGFSVERNDGASTIVETLDILVPASLSGRDIVCG